MLKLKLTWEMETGEKFEEWTRPIELSLAEKELYNNKSIVKILIDESTPSNTLLLFLAHKIQQRVSKKIENFDTWKTKVTDIAASDFETANFTKPDQYRANSSRASNSDWDNTRLLAQCRTRYLGYSHRHIERAG
jgi:hypothetical protein